MRFPALVESFRARLLLLLALMLGLTLGIQYYFNLRAVKANARMIIEQEQAIMTGIGLGLKSLQSEKYLVDIVGQMHDPLLNNKRVRVRNILVVDDAGNIWDSLNPEYNPRKNADNSSRYVQFKDIQLLPLRSVVPSGNESEQPLPSWIPPSTTPDFGEAGAFFFPVETDQGRRFIIVVLDSANVLTNVFERQTSRSALLTLAVLFVTTLITGFFVWRFTRPIKELAFAARNVASGNFEVRVQTGRRDEMGTLATAFNEMTAKLGRARELEFQLHQAEKGAVVGRLAAAIAHDIRNPLNYINLTLDHLRSSFSPADPEKKATFIQLTAQLKTEVARINRHISDFLKYSRPSTLELQDLDIREEAEDALRLVEGRAEECGIETKIIQDGPLPKVPADRESLRSVFTNLVVNAVEAIDGGGGNVSIKLSNADANSVKVEISDSGCGISAEDIAKVFEPYFSTKDTGTGLGLAIVKKAVDDHGGTISVESKQGSGTTFTIILPATKEN
ncbi:MAG TPA: ATP-binding protein [Pyrinomonadaceae bacterium]|jgi:signal transduction histidine kinase|nr:ATP-binding protein [Pyrinomonadaceae bacterium]